MPSRGGKIVRPEDFGWTWGRAKQSSSLPSSSGSSTPLPFDEYSSWGPGSWPNAFGTPKLPSGSISAEFECHELSELLRKDLEHWRQTQMSTPSAATTSSGSSHCLLTSKPSGKSPGSPSTASSSTSPKVSKAPPPCVLRASDGYGVSWPGAISPPVRSCRTATATFGIRCISLTAARGWAKLKRLFSRLTSTRR